ncbi:MAG: radical SAM protein [Defluviitaleaceae bacterium]|nr:radical SAM protein [Defluviitaleaceae bacterium]
MLNDLDLLNLLNAKIDHAHTCLDRLWHGIADIKQMFDFQRQAMIRIMPRNNLRIGFFLTTHCNLNCMGCATYAPCANNVTDGDFLDLTQFRLDMKRLSELFDDGEIRSFSLTGGEPLLNPSVYEYPYIIRNYFPNANLRLVTNGILLTKQDEKFWNSMKANDVTIEQTKFPINIDYKRIEELVNGYDIRHFYMNEGEGVKTLWRYPIVLQRKARNKGYSDYDSRINFISCGNANDCICLMNGKLYTCARIPLIKIFNKHFNSDLPVSEYDGINIYKAKNRDEIYRFLANPVPFCAYCRPSRITVGHPFELSKLDISEWADDE